MTSDSGLIARAGGAGFLQQFPERVLVGIPGLLVTVAHTEQSPLDCLRRGIPLEHVHFPDTRLLPITAVAERLGHARTNPPISIPPYAYLSQATDNKRQSIASIAAYVGVFLWDGSKWQQITPAHLPCDGGCSTIAVCVQSAMVDALPYRRAQTK